MQQATMCDAGSAFQMPMGGADMHMQQGPMGGAGTPMQHMLMGGAGMPMQHMPMGGAGMPMQHMAMGGAFGAGMQQVPDQMAFMPFGGGVPHGISEQDKLFADQERLHARELHVLGRACACACVWLQRLD